MQRRMAFLFAFWLAFFSAVPLLHAAELNLAHDARITLSGIDDDGIEGYPNALEWGVASLRDGDSSTFWKPPTDVDRWRTWIEIDLSPNDAQVALTLERIELEWVGSSPADLWISAGSDPLTMRTWYQGDPGDDATSILLPKEGAPTGVRFVRIDFVTGTLKLAELGLYVDETTLPARPTLEFVEVAGAAVGIGWQAASDVHHYEIERDTGMDATTVRWDTPLTKAGDRPPAAGEVRWRVRSVGFDGRMSAWSEDLVKANYQPPVLTGLVLRGVVEGADIAGWSAEIRKRLIQRLGVWGMNLYVQAPRGDATRTEDWRNPPDAAAIETLTELKSWADAFGVRFVYGLYPGMGDAPIDADDALDQAELEERLRPLAEAGITDFALIFDNLQDRADKLLGEDHAQLAARILTWMRGYDPAAMLILTPAVQTGDAERLPDDHLEYLQNLHDLDPAILVTWQGPERFSTRIENGEFPVVADIVGRLPLFWDNFSANDDSDVLPGRRLHFFPVEGRSSTLLASAAGILVNPMVQVEAGAFTLASYAELAENPATYDPESSPWIARAIDSLDPGVPLEEWERLRTVFARHDSLKPDYVALSEIPETVERMEDAISSRDGEVLGKEAAELIDFLTPYYRFPATLRSLLQNRFLRDELDVSLDKFSAQTRAGMLAINLIQALAWGQAGRFISQERELARLRDEEIVRSQDAADEAFSSLFSAAGDYSYEGIFDVKSGSYSESGFSPIEVEALEQARLGQPWNYHVGYNARSEAEWQLDVDSEAAGMSVDADGLVSWTPETVGLHRAVAVKIIDDAVLAVPFEVRAVPSLWEPGENLVAPNTEVVEVDELPVLFQNGQVYPSFGEHNWERLPISGPWRKIRRALDHDLSFAPRDEEVIERMLTEAGTGGEDYFESDPWEDVTLPAVENGLGENGSPEQYFGGIWYAVTVSLPGGSARMRLAMAACSYITDVWAKEEGDDDYYWLGMHEGGSTPAYFEIPSPMRNADLLDLLIRVDHPRPGLVSGMFPPVAQADWWHYAGAIQEVAIEYLPKDKKVNIVRADAQYTGENGGVRLIAVVEEMGLLPRQIKVKVHAHELDNTSSSYFSSPDIKPLLTREVSITGLSEVETTVEAGGRRAVAIDFQIQQDSLWSPDAPRLFGIEVEALDFSDGKTEGEQLDVLYFQFGLRHISVVNGLVQFNGDYPFWPGVGRQEEGYEGRSQDWDSIRFDLEKIKALGVRFLRTGQMPNHPYTYLLADRIGLAVLAEIPAWKLEENHYAEQKTRPTALQTWRETTRTLHNRASVVMLGAASDSAPGEDGQLLDFVDEMKNDLATFSDDPPLVTVSFDAETLLGDDSAPAFEVLEKTADVAGVASYIGTRYLEDYDLVDSDVGVGGAGEDAEERTNQFLQDFKENLPDKPLIITEFGHVWESSDDVEDRQRLAFEKTWDGAIDFFQIDDAGRRQEEGYIFSAVWWSAFDWYSSQSRTRSMGVLQMDRQRLKPAGWKLRETYTTFGEANASDEGDIVPILPDSRCASMDAPVGLALFALLALAAILRRFNGFRQGTKR